MTSRASPNSTAASEGLDAQALGLGSRRSAETFEGKQASCGETARIERSALGREGWPRIRDAFRARRVPGQDIRKVSAKRQTADARPNWCIRTLDPRRKEECRSGSIPGSSSPRRRRSGRQPRRQEKVHRLILARAARARSQAERRAIQKKGRFRPKRNLIQARQDAP